MTVLNTLELMIASRKGLADRLAKGASFRRQTVEKASVDPSPTGFIECPMRENVRRKIQDAIDKLDLAIGERQSQAKGP